MAARGITASMMSSAPAALVTKNSRSRAAMSDAPGVRGQHVDVERAEVRRAASRAARRPRRAGRPRTPPGRRPDRPAPPAAPSSGIPRSSPAARVMLLITRASAYSRMVGSMPLATMRGTACVTSASVANGASTVAVSVSRGCTLTVTSVVTASVPSDPMSSWVRS